MIGRKPPQCAMCPLVARGQGFSWGYGTGSNGVMLLGEALGDREVQLGRPFVGQAGAQLSRTLERVGSRREDFRVDNTCRCQPPNNWLENAPWEMEAVLNCSYYSMEAMKKYQPKAIVALGNVPMSFTMGLKGVEKYRGYVYRRNVEGHSCYVVPTYHPAFLARGKAKLTEVQAIDIRRALKVAKEGFKEPEVKYGMHPNSADMAQFTLEARSAAARGAWLAADIETPQSGSVTEDEYGEITDATIICISFAFKPHHAITIPWCNENFEAIQRILEIPFQYVVFWNQSFDVPRLQAKGIRFGGRILDAMFMWHFLQSDLPKGLGYVAPFFTEVKEWKSLSGTHPEYYSCKDADVTIQCAYKIRERLIRQNRFDRFIRHYVELQPLLESMVARGVLIDTVQQEKFRGEVNKELERLDEEIQRNVPLEAKLFVPRKTIPRGTDIGDRYSSSAYAGTWDFDRETGEIGIRRDFLATSPPQVIGYMRFRGHPVPKDHKTDKPTTGAAEIENLADNYPDDQLYPRILKARGFRKVMGQYIDGYQPDPDGRIRTHFDRKPSTWRFNSYKPNVQNVLKRSELGLEEEE